MTAPNTQTTATRCIQSNVSRKRYRREGKAKSLGNGLIQPIVNVLFAQKSGLQTRELTVHAVRIVITISVMIAVSADKAICLKSASKEIGNTMLSHVLAATRIRLTTSYHVASCTAQDATRGSAESAYRERTTFD